MKLFDISEPLYKGMTIWPGDVDYQFNLSEVKTETNVANVGFVSFSCHTGTHIDAPYHFNNEGKKVHELDLSIYVGPCKVIHLPNLDSITSNDLAHYELDGVQRLLIRTDSWLDRTKFSTHFTFIEPETAFFLQKKGVKLLGLDVPSVDPADSEELLAHHALHQSDVHILERAVLTEIEPGDYELIACPLPIVNGDGSPVRAVLRQE
jgi:arylformamidase